MVETLTQAELDSWSRIRSLPEFNQSFGNLFGGNPDNFWASLNPATRQQIIELYDTQAPAAPMAPVLADPVIPAPTPINPSTGPEPVLMQTSTVPLAERLDDVNIGPSTVLPVKRPMRMLPRPSLDVLAGAPPAPLTYDIGQDIGEGISGTVQNAQEYGVPASLGILAGKAYRGATDAYDTVVDAGAQGLRNLGAGILAAGDVAAESAADFAAGAAQGYTGAESPRLSQQMTMDQATSGIPRGSVYEQPAVLAPTIQDNLRERPMLAGPYSDPEVTRVAGPGQGVLVDTTAPAATPAALNSPETVAPASRGSISYSPAPESVVSSSGPKTSNARGSAMPQLLIDRNEALIRIGGAMLEGSSQGYGAAMGAATREFGAIQDANRTALEAEQEQKREQAQRAAEAITASSDMDDPVTRRRIVASIQANQGTLRSLRLVAQEYAALKNSPEGSPLRLQNQARYSLLVLADRLGMAGPEAQESISNVTQFKTRTTDMLNKYIKEITGAAMSQAEATRIIASMPNVNMSDAQFDSALNRVINDIEAAIARQQGYLDGNLTVQGSGDDIVFLDANGRVVGLGDTQAPASTETQNSSVLTYNPETEEFD